MEKGGAGLVELALSGGGLARKVGFDGADSLAESGAVDEDYGRLDLELGAERLLFCLRANPAGTLLSGDGAAAAVRRTDYLETLGAGVGGFVKLAHKENKIMAASLPPRVRSMP